MSEWLEQQSGIDIYTPTKPGQRRRGITVFLHTPTYTGKECLVVHGFYIDKEGNKRRHYFNRKVGGGKFQQNYYMVSIPKDMAGEVVSAMLKVLGGVRPAIANVILNFLGGAKEADKKHDVSKDLEELGI